MRRFFGDGAIYAVTGVVGHGIAFLLFPFFAHVFEPRDFGLIDMLALVTVLVNLTIALEISQGLGRHFADATTLDERRGYASTALIFSVAAYSGVLVVALIFAPQLTDLIFGGGVDPNILRVSMCAMWTSGILYLGQDLLRWQLRPRAYAAVALTTAGVTSISAGVLILGFGVGVTGAFVAQLLGGLTAGTLAYWLGRDMFRPIFDRAKLREMLAFSLPLVPASIGVFLNGYADRLAIQSQMTLADVGIYGAAYRMAVIVGLVLLGFQAALMPLVLARHAEPSTPPELERIFRLFCALALAVLLLVSIAADAILRVLTPPAYYAAADVAPFVVAAAFFAGMYIFAPGLNIVKRTVPFAVITASAGLANLMLAFALVGPLGIAGAALAFLLTSAAGFATLMVTSQRVYPVPHDWPRLITSATGIGVLVAIARTLPEQPALAVPANLAIAAAGLAAIVRWLVAPDERAHLMTLLARLRRLRPAVPRTP
ncbi:MAG: oligosaccharide flippase family protein [Actinobacteria bacterium]|nr:oligosaccharide flippase family protein [Actinomycetota bacterium]